MPYNSIGTLIGPEDAALTVMCQGVRVHVELELGNLCEPQGGVGGGPRQQFLDFLERLEEDPDATQEFEDWMLLPCMPEVRQHTDPATRKEHSNLQSYYHPETLIFSLMQAGGCLEAKLCPDDPQLTKWLKPQLPILDESVASALQNGLPCFQASQVTIIRADVSDWVIDEIPRTVRTPGIQGQLYFKTAFDRGSFKRELNALVRTRANDPKQELRVTRLAGLVKWDDEDSIGGLLMNYTADTDNLGWVAGEASEAERSRWALEVRRTVERLHSLGVIWGDAKAANVLVDADRQAWVVDFNGGYTEGWVDKELENTRDGDLQGVARIEEFLKTGVRPGEEGQE